MSTTSYATERQQQLDLLRDSAVNFSSKESPLSRARALRGQQPGFDRSFWGALAAQGWTGLLVPEALGGYGQGLAEMAEVTAALAAQGAPEPVVPVLVFAGRLLQACGHNDVARRVLADMVAGTALPAVAWQEDATGAASLAADGSLALPASRLEASDGGWRLSGDKRHVRPGAGADGYIVTALCGGELALVWLPAGSAGLGVSSERLADGSQAARLHLDHIAVPAAQVLARGAAAQAALVAAYDETLLLSSVELLALSRRMVAMTLDYLRTRKQFGKPIGSFQALQHRAVDLHIQQELCAAVVAQALAAFDAGCSGAERALLAARVKARCAEAALTTGRDAVQLHGAIGITDEYDLGLYLQRAMVVSAWLGNASTQRRRYAALDRHPTTAATEKARTAPNPTIASSAPTDWNALDIDTFRATVRGFFEQHFPSELRYPKQRLRWVQIKDWTLKLARQGWLAPSWPVQHGGMGLSPEKLIAFIEEQERHGVARAPDQGITMVGPLLIQHGNDAQRAHYLPKILSCEHIWCQGYSEPNSGSDLASLRTSAVVDGDDFVVNGQKIWTTLAQDATHIYLLVRTDPDAKKQQGISFLLADMKTPGITVRPIRNIAGGEDFCEVFLENVRVPRANLVGELNKGWTIAKALLGFERIFLGSPKQSQYALARLREAAELLGLFDDAGFSDRYTQLALDVADQSTLYSAFVERIKRGETLGPDVSMLKIFGTETYSRLANLLVEAAGASGATPGDIELPGGHLDVLTTFYNARPATIYGGSNEIQRNILAASVLQLPSA